MAKKTYRIAGRGVDEVNNYTTSDGFVKNIAHKTVNIPAVVDTPAANTELLNAYQNYGAVSGNPLTQTTQVTQTQNPLTGNTTTTSKSYSSKYEASPLTNMYKEKMLQSENGRPGSFDYDDFDTSARTDRYSGLLRDTEESRPGPYESLYESTINEILDTIKNRQPFDVANDANYKQLYDQYAERYRANAQRAMNDAMASANAATGGYGSTYGQAVGQQAYDRTMEGLNDQNLNLLNLAYSIYEGDRANDYNKLGAFQGQDQMQYGRYRDTVNDWQTDRNYYAGQYQQNYQNDRSAYDTDRSFAYNQYRDNVSDWENDRAYNSGQYWNSYGSDYQVTQDEYQRDDANYQDALKEAMSLAKAGLPVPDYITARINQYNQKYGLGSGADTTAYLQALAAQALAAKASSGSGGSGKSRSSGGSSKSDKNSGKTMTLWESLRTLKQIAEQEGIDAAESEMKTIRKYITGVNNETIDKSFDEFISDWKKGKTTNINKINGNRPR
jgi:hypothetical protein